METSKNILTIVQRSKEKDFDGIATDSQSWFQYIFVSSRRFAPSPADAILSVWHACITKETMIIVFFRAGKIGLVDILSKPRKFSQVYDLARIFPDLKKPEVRVKGHTPRSRSGYTDREWNVPEND
jgi:hypothetical protein